MAHVTVSLSEIEHRPTPPVTTVNGYVLAVALHRVRTYAVTRKSSQCGDCVGFGDVDLRKNQILKKAEVCTVVLASRSGRYDDDILKQIMPPSY